MLADIAGLTHEIASRSLGSGLALEFSYQKLSIGTKDQPGGTTGRAHGAVAGLQSVSQPTNAGGMAINTESGIPVMTGHAPRVFAQGAAAAQKKNGDKKRAQKDNFRAAV